MHQEAASEIAGTEVQIETDGKKNTNGYPVGRHSSKIKWGVEILGNISDGKQRKKQWNFF